MRAEDYNSKEERVGASWLGLGPYDVRVNTMGSTQLSISAPPISGSTHPLALELISPPPSTRVLGERALRIPRTETMTEFHVEDLLGTFLFRPDPYQNVDSTLNNDEGIKARQWL